MKIYKSKFWAALVVAIAVGALAAPTAFAEAPSETVQESSKTSSTAESSSKDSVTVKKIDHLITEIKEKHEIVVEYKSVPSSTGIAFSRDHDYDELYDALVNIEKGLALYPKDFAKTIFLNKIYLCQNLRANKTILLDGLSQGSFMKSKLVRTSIYLNYPSQHGALSTLHHELFHAIEYAFPVDSKSWRELVAPTDYGFKGDYFSNQDAARDGTVLRKPGFFSLYSYTSAPEDRAEIFTNLMYYSQSSLMKAQHANDPLIKEKSDFVIKHIEKSLNSKAISKLLLDNIEENYKSIFDRVFFSTKTLQYMKESAVVYTTPDKNGKAITLKKGELVYLLDKMRNPRETYLALDVEGNLIYLPSKLTTELKSNEFNLVKQLSKLESNNITVSFSLSTPTLKAEPLGGLDEMNSSQKLLAFSNLQTVLNYLASHDSSPINRIELVSDMFKGSDYCAVRVTGKTLSIDISHAKASEIIAALAS